MRLRLREAHFGAGKKRLFRMWFMLACQVFDITPDVTVTPWFGA